MGDGNEDDNLKLRRLAGGSIVDYPPLFSSDGDAILVIFKNLVQVYSTTTGEWLRDLEGVKDEIIGIQYDLNNPKIVFALSKTGEMIRWKWETGENLGTRLLPFDNYTVLSFHLVDVLPESTSGFMTYTSSVTGRVDWAVVDMPVGERLTNLGWDLDLGRGWVQVDVENVHFHYVAIIQGMRMYLVSYKHGFVKQWRNGNKSPFTVVRVHPEEEMIATGDSMGRIFLWRNIFGAHQPQTCLYHWHHTPVTSIAFTKSGSGFYSGGQESVLVQWNMSRPDLKNFLPRMHAIIIHIAVGENNRKVAVCTADNGIQILDSQNKAKCMLQGFTYVYNDKTGLDKFPMGMKLNPRTNSLALNGRIGHIQFYSTYTRRLLHNVDVVLQNRLSMESEKILYNIRVTSAAFNVDWMATVEELNDQEHCPEVRLKFWQFDKESQNYTLNTNVEQPHEGSVKAVEFSSALDTENLLCATAGCDNYLKIWALEDSASIHKKGKVWFCIARTNYKNFNLECISFSQDGSLLSAGFRNSLCIYKSQTLALKAVLSAPGKFNGTIQEVDIQIPQGKLENSQSDYNGKKGEVLEKRRKILELFKSLLETNDNKLIQELQKGDDAVKKKNINSGQSLCNMTLDTAQQEYLFKKIRSLTDLSLFQKVDLYQKLGIYCSVPKESRNQIAKYIAKNILEKDSIECNLDRNIKSLSKKYRFKAKYRIHKHLSRKVKHEDDDKLISVMSLLGLSDHPTMHHTSHNKKSIVDSKGCNGFIEDDAEMESSSDVMETLKPLEVVSNIRHVAFATGEYAHLVIVCTENRVLIWNILTLRLQSVLRLSVFRITVDPLTSLCAAFTINDELYVFPPNAPMPLYHRVNIPKIHDAIWLPRRYPKSYSLNLDWQAISTLYFLTKDQELTYLADDKDDDITVAATFTNEAQDVARYSTFGTFAAKQANARIVQSSKNATAIGVTGKAAVKSLYSAQMYLSFRVMILYDVSYSSSNF
ncbi:unnamed protein product [Hermetia illucens]|uniref:WD repeat-containing protein 75 second beta-propeller domain-containing protein n=1 Tax=Hermetia illucens TaxID=343691 RepID=A0A7R8UEN0_HERIL|nr:unnamed protein product [Hermetia illucens]